MAFWTDPKSLKQVKIVSNYFKMTVDELCFGPNDKIHSIDEFSDEINAGIFEEFLEE
ncbi:hypothetical protein ACJVC5_03495 [Peredibacter sp. HCB2-198]|uniref:hypothetical protein n=1 Tax=Peredibacter sp. HCB2-198 TaxID=3383025 RepID=UPI0038B4EC1D